MVPITEGKAMMPKNVTSLILGFLFLSLSLGPWEGVWAAEGIKARVAVARFGANDRFVQAYGGWDIGGGLAAQLVTELINSNQVILVERAILSQVLREQELAVSNLVTKETSTRVGDLLGVDYLLVGEVTEFEQKAVGAGGHAGLFKGMLTKASVEYSAAHVGIDFRVIDTATGEIIHAQRVVGRAWERAAAVDITPGAVAFGGDAFHKTPLGKATRKVINEALSVTLGVINNKLQSYDWLGKIIHQNGTLLYINAGSLAGLKVGDMLSAFSIQKVLVDPETNQTIGMIENRLGDMTVVSVSDKFSTAELKKGTAAPPPNGSVVRYSSKEQGGPGQEGYYNNSAFRVSKKGYPILE